jgi:hypothetical protein
MTNPLSPEPTAGTDRTIEAKPLWPPVSKADALRRALAQLEQARTIAVELSDETHPLKRDSRGEPASAIGSAVLEPEPIEIEPRPCEFCGLTIDQHRMIDDEPPPPEIVRNSDISGKQANTPPPYRTPQATVDAFWYVVSLCNPERLKAWLVDHPQDAPFLLKLLEGK